MRAAPWPCPDCCLLLPQLKTREGSEFLIQHDSEQIITAWQKAIADSIGRLVSRCPPTPALPPSGWAQGSHAAPSLGRWPPRRGGCRKRG